jgi:hypothetical protein
MRAPALPRFHLVAFSISAWRAGALRLVISSYTSGAVDRRCRCVFTGPDPQQHTVRTATRLNSIRESVGWLVARRDLLMPLRVVPCPFSVRFQISTATCRWRDVVLVSGVSGSLARRVACFIAKSCPD